MSKIPLFKERDTFIILGLLILGLIGIILPRLFVGDVNAQISFDGVVVKEVNLSENSIFEVNNIKFAVKNNSISVAHSNCHDKICEKTGFISSPAQVIVCIPNKLVVKIVSNKNDIDITVG